MERKWKRNGRLQNKGNKKNWDNKTDKQFVEFFWGQRWKIYHQSPLLSFCHMSRRDRRVLLTIFPLLLFLWNCTFMWVTGLNCDVEVSSDVTKNGSITSPNFPGPYPAGVHCNYHFHGSGRERVQLVFSDFDLIVPSEEMSGRECEGMDTVSVYVTVNGNKEKIDHLCGTEIPAQVMSNSPTMKVEFKSMNLVTENHSKGFRAVYRFTKDFGIRATGIQDVNRGVCAYVFNSTSSRNGSFTSPNFPGLYPRDTECHYFFYGRSSERVEITFTHFDIEGVQPCTSVTASDYVEFSNHRSADRKIPRHCGLLKPKTVESEGNFFRVTFKSNDRFDGTGFQAVYYFKNPAGNQFSFSSKSSIVFQSIAFFLQTHQTWRKWKETSQHHPHHLPSQVLLSTIIYSSCLWSGQQ